MANEHLMSTYSRKMLLVKGLGCYVYDADAKQYLDMIGGIATCSVGHANPEVVDVISKQAATLINASNLFYTNEQETLAEKLCDISGLKKCFFSNSGTEAIEAAIKLARKYTGKPKIIAMKDGFHGRTLGSLSATWNEKYKKGFGELLAGFHHADFGDISALEKLIDNDTAAVIIEPIQGEAGVIVAPAGYLKQASELCRTYGALLILDETQCGNGRTGKYFCYQTFGVLPDIVTTAKGLANGLPIGVTIAGEGIDFSPGDHGSTFGGNSLCCAAALKTIEIIEKLMPEVNGKGEYLMAGIKQIDSDKIKEVRGMGLMVGIELKTEAKPIVDKCADEGLVINCVHDKVIRLLPPLTITEEQIGTALSIIGKVLSDWED